MEVQFSDYLGNPIYPTENVVLRNNTLTEYIVTEEESDHPFGSRTGGNVHSNWKIEGDKMKVVGIKEVQPREITGVFEFKFISLTTSDKSYTKFKYVQ